MNGDALRVLALMAAVFGMAMGAAPLLQLYRMVRLRSSRDISMGFFAVAVAGQFTWVAYGAALHNLAVVLSNGCGMLANAGVFLAAVILRRRPVRGEMAGTVLVVQR